MNLFKTLCSALTLLLPALATAGELQVAQGRFVDRDGATVVLRGFNLSQQHKLPPFRPNNDPQLFQKLAAKGVNVVRLQFNWEAYELSPGVYDDSYLDYYAGVSARAAASGVYVIVDIHQDAFSRWTLDGCGEGFPRWAIPAGTRLSEPDNGSKCWFWPLRVMAERREIEAVFNAFYTPGNPARERYLVLLERLAQRFADQPHVIGFDLLNEPLGDAGLLAQLYLDGIERVRRHDPDAIAFVEPEMLTGSGLETTKLARMPISNLAFAPHYYDATIYASVWLGGRYEPVAARNRELAKTWGAAVLLGEFGTPSFLLAPNYIKMIYDDLDNFGDSATQWSWTPEWTPQNLDGWNREDLSVVDDKGRLRNNYRERPYARRTAGAYGNFKVSFAGLFNPASARFRWSHNPAQGTTEIFVPDSFLGGRAPVVSAPADVRCTFSHERRVLACRGSQTGMKEVVLK